MRDTSGKVHIKDGKALRKLLKPRRDAEMEDFLQKPAKEFDKLMRRVRQLEKKVAGLEVTYRKLWTKVEFGIETENGEEDAKLQDSKEGVGLQG